MRHSIQIERRGSTLDSLGHDNSGTWVIVSGRIPCKVQDLTGRELEIAKQQVAEATVKITCRKLSVFTTDRVLFGERVLQISAITLNHKGTEQTILCAEAI